MTQQETPKKDGSHNIFDKLKIYGRKVEAEPVGNSNATTHEEHPTKQQQERDVLQKWHNLSSAEDLLNLMNDVSKIVFGSSAEPYSKKMFNLQAYSSNNPHRYHSFKIPK